MRRKQTLRRTAAALLLLLALLHTSTSPAAAQRRRAAPAPAASATARTPPRTRLVLFIAVDQFRYDYLERFGDLFGAGGLRRLLTGGATWTDVQLRPRPDRDRARPRDDVDRCRGPPRPASSPTTGTTAPKASASTTCRTIRCARSAAATSEAASSPRNLLASTLGDQLKMASAGRSRVVGISVEEPRRHPARRAHGRRRLLVQQPDRPVRLFHLLLRPFARLGHALQCGAPRRQVLRREVGAPAPRGRVRATRRP